MPQDGPLLLRFLAKLVFDILPAALASVIGGILFTHYQSGFARAPKPVAAQVAPASAEMVQLLRDEHAAIVDFLKAQMAAEKARLAAADQESARSEAEARAAIVAVAAPAPAAPRRSDAAANAVSTARSAATRARGPAAAAATAPPRAPLVIAQAPQGGSAAPAASAPRDPDSLLAKTLDIKDHVVDATLHVIGAIGSIPSLIGSMGDHVGGSSASSPPAGRLAGASS